MSRVAEGIYVKIHKIFSIAPKFDGFKVSYMLTWGLVMFLFELDKSILNHTMCVSMDFIYKDSDKDLESWKELVPIDLNFLS